MKRVTVVFWTTIAFGFAVSPLVAIGAATAKGTPFASAVSEFMGHLFEPGYNEFLIALFTSLPFVAGAVFLMFHLAAEPTPLGRWAGVAGALCTGTALALWGLIAIRMSRSSTASIGYIFLPFEALFVMPIGYVAGRLLVKLKPVN
jgi:hypothetical protein